MRRPRAGGQRVREGQRVRGGQRVRFTTLGDGSVTEASSWYRSYLNPSGAYRGMGV